MLVVQRVDVAGEVDPAFRAGFDSGTDTVGLWWLGQSGFALRYHEMLVLVDPYLSDSLAAKYRNGIFTHVRLVPVPVAPEQVRGCDAVLCTHGHTDHMDPPTIHGLQEMNAPVFVVPRAERARAIERGAPPDRIIGTNAGELLDLGGGVSVQPIPSAHEDLVVDADGNHRFLGYVISLGSVRLYHSGDCIPYDGLAEQLSRMQVDAALLPINGRDDFRRANGVPGNFTAAEAAALCAAAGISHLIVHHIGMFSFNMIAPEQAIQRMQPYASSVQALLPEIGTLYRLQHLK